MKSIDFYKEHLPLLEKLFGEKQLLPKKERLEEIFVTTEQFWADRTQALQGKKVKYLLICEAPPYSEEGEPAYFYGQINTSFFTRIWKGIFPTTPKPDSKLEAYTKLAEKGFLLIDSMPYPMRYTPIKRRAKSYAEILKYSIPHMVDVLEQHFEFDESLKIAFGFKLNALVIMNITANQLAISGNTYQFDESNIAADGSGFTSSKKLREIFGIRS